MRYSILLLASILLLSSCASQDDSSFTSIRPGDNIKVDPDPLVFSGTVSLIDDPHIAGFLNITGALVVGNTEVPANITLFDDEGNMFLCGVQGNGNFKCVPQ